MRYPLPLQRDRPAHSSTGRAPESRCRLHVARHREFRRLLLCAGCRARECPRALPGRCNDPQVICTEAVMGTFVSIEVDAPEAPIKRAFEWFHLVEAHCSRFDAGSELRQLTAGQRTPVSPILFEAVRFALMVAEETGGAFDPTVGGSMAARGFNRNYLTGETCEMPGGEEK